MRAAAILVALCLASTAAAQDDTAANKNQDKEQGTKKNLLKPTNKVESWRFEQHEAGKGEIKATEEAIVFNVTKVTGTNWHVQAFQVDLDLKEGQQYTLKFKIRAPENRSVAVTAMIDEEDWHDIGLFEEIYATKEFQAHELRFSASGVRKGKNRVGFVLGDSEGTVEVKDMTLEE